MLHNNNTYSHMTLSRKGNSVLLSLDFGPVVNTGVSIPIVR